MRRLLVFSLSFLVTSSIFGRVYAEDIQNPALSDVGVYSADARTARISMLKDKYKIKLDEREKALVISRCSGAQEGLKAIAARLVTVKRDRETSYSSAITSLIRLRSLLTSKHIDTSSIDLLVVSYQQSKTMFDSSFLNYELSLEDAGLLDCKSKPEDFRAALEGVRASRKPVIEASSQITEITKSNLKTTFDSIRLKLQTEDVGNGQ